MMNKELDDRIRQKQNKGGRRRARMQSTTAVASEVNFSVAL